MTSLCDQKQVQEMLLLCFAFNFGNRGSLMEPVIRQLFNPLNTIIFNGQTCEQGHCPVKTSPNNLTDFP